MRQHLARQFGFLVSIPVHGQRGGNLTQASLELGMAKTTLFDKVKKYGLSH